MRQIKFRAWGRRLMDDDNTMSDSFVLTDVCQECGTYDGPRGVDMQSEAVIMQYTGMNDKDGIEIYEGDLVEFKAYGSTILAEVFYDDSSARYMKRGQHDGFGGLFDKDLASYASTQRVVGNKYDTPPEVQEVS